MGFSGASEDILSIAEYPGLIAFKDVIRCQEVCLSVWISVWARLRSPTSVNLPYQDSTLSKRPV